jgi:hypothetical protein
MTWLTPREKHDMIYIILIAISSIILTWAVLSIFV